MALFKLGTLRSANKRIRQATRLVTQVWEPFVAPTPPRKPASAPRKKPGATANARASVALARTVPSGLPGGAGFFGARFSYRRAEHAYKVYLPPLSAAQPAAGLLVMLHGCHQSPDDFAAGTRMNDLARDAHVVVLYPCQPASAHPQQCWNWFDPRQGRGTGEPAWIAALTRMAMKQWGLRRAQVFIAGLSAGGAMAATVAHAYPDVFAACGVHSGLAAGAARGMIGALSAMRHGTHLATTPPTRQVRTIVFHGDRDRTVHPRHGAHVIAAALRPAATGPRTANGVPVPEVVPSRSPSGREFTRRIYRDARQRIAAEYWQVHGMGHAWSGGSARGSYVDPMGPDASAAMLEFFLAPPPA